jgi:hypothetical protein
MPTAHVLCPPPATPVWHSRYEHVNSPAPLVLVLLLLLVLQFPIRILFHRSQQREQSASSSRPSSFHPQLHAPRMEPKHNPHPNRFATFVLFCSKEKNSPPLPHSYSFSNSRSEYLFTEANKENEAPQVVAHPASIPNSPSPRMEPRRIPTSTASLPSFPSVQKEKPRPYVAGASVSTCAVS